jgi:hypothetical protein
MPDQPMGVGVEVRLGRIVILGSSPQRLHANRMKILDRH